jgi:hypothetical protein
MKETSKAASRRDFLKLAGASAPAAAVALTAGGVEAEDVAEATGTGLRKTAHVEAYLETARF